MQLQVQYAKLILGMKLLQRPVWLQAIANYAYTHLYNNNKVYLYVYNI